MSRRMLLSTIAAVGLASGLGFSVPATAGTAWSVSIAGPGYAVAAGRPALVAGPRYVAPYYRHWHRHYRPRVVVYAAPVNVYQPPVIYAPAPVAYPVPRVVYGAPVVVRPW